MCSCVETVYTGVDVKGLDENSDEGLDENSDCTCTDYLSIILMCVILLISQRISVSKIYSAL